MSEMKKDVGTIDEFSNKIICSDSLEMMKKLPSRSIDLIITSPPYFKQRLYSQSDKEIGREKNVDAYVNNLLELFHECVRIIKEEGNIVFNVGDKYEEGSLLLVPYRFALKAVETEPVKLVNSITWAKLNPTPRQYKRRLASSTEPFFHFVISNNYYYNYDAFLSDPNSIPRKNKNSDNKGREYFKLIDGSDLTEEQKNMAKNELTQVILEVTEGKIYDFRMKIRGIHSMPFGGQEGGRKTQILKNGFTIIKMGGNPIKRDIILSSVETIGGAKHPAIYPEYIIQELLKLMTKEGDIVLDPFIGSGTTAVACKKLGRRYIGFDINPDFCQYAEERLKEVKKENIKSQEKENNRENQAKCDDINQTKLRLI
jgi:site-specific DNA-methyltransferase (adenine-specific)